MPIRDAGILTVRPAGVSDALDGTNAFPGAMTRLANLVPDPTTDGMWVCRPAAVRLTQFAGFTTPGFVSALLVVGDVAYGLIASGRNAGKDEPFAYDLVNNVFLPVAGVTAGACPASPATTGAWTPPIMAQVGTRIVVTHPGFPGGAVKFGWFDISGFSSTSLTGTTTSGSNQLTAMPSSPLAAGVQPGHTISGAGIPAGATVVSCTATTITMSANATASAAGVALTIAGGTPAAPLWGAGDCQGAPLPSPPTAVAAYNGRAWFACGASLAFSDALLAATRTNATQALTPSNGLPVTALGALPLSAAMTGGIVQSLIAFQGGSAMQQVTGDQATADLRLDAMNVATGTEAPLSVRPTTKGLAFVSPSGLRVVDFTAKVSDPIGASGAGVTTPLIYALVPSRVCAAFNADVFRVTTQDAQVTGQPVEEFWLDAKRGTWSGPHSFPADQIQPWRAGFVLAPRGVTGSLWRSDAVPATGSSYTENGVDLTWTYQTVLSPDNGQGGMNAVVETALTLALPAEVDVTVIASDENGDTLDQVSLGGDGAGSSTWGGFAWGAGTWGGGAARPRERRVPWAHPVVFKQMRFQATGYASGAVKVGNLYVSVQPLNYMLGS
jgi:hypothetical protein